MSKPIIEVENLSKLYHLGTIGATTLRQSVEHWWDKMRGKQKDALSKPLHQKITPEQEGPEANSFWALKDIGFQVQQGEVIGIVGKNGAGKSTLLKILSRITEPTHGRAVLRGRVASLLEVGTGFHPELTGRENIFLNGAILGMKRVEIDRKFDEIVDFAEVADFIDTPVKRYSSGMYVRLAFAVAAHLEPEILIVDEVLAVGDADFQKKCLGKMNDVSREGRTVLFVSHSMPAILRLCKRVILMGNGQVIGDGPAEEVTRKYLASGVGRAAERVWSNLDDAPGDAVARLRAVRLLNAAGEVAETIDVSEPFQVEVEYWNLQSRIKPTVSIHFTNESGVLLFVSNDFSNQEWWATVREPGVIRARCQVPRHLLSEGRIFILGALCSYNPDVIHALERDVISFQAVDRHDVDNTREKYSRAWPGAVRPRLEWKIEKVSASTQ